MLSCSQEIVPIYCTPPGLLLIITIIAFTGFIIWFFFIRKPKPVEDPYNQKIPDGEVNPQNGITYRQLLENTLTQKADITILSIDPHKNTITVSFTYPGSEATVIKVFNLSGLVINNDCNVLRGIVKIKVSPNEDLLNLTPKDGEIDWKYVINSYTTYAFYANPDTVQDLFKS